MVGIVTNDETGGRRGGTGSRRGRRGSMSTAAAGVGVVVPSAVVVPFVSLRFTLFLSL